MSKAILVIDMPSNCRECKLSACAYGGDIVIDYCSALLDNDEIINKEEKLTNCPLKPVTDRNAYAVIVNGEVIFIEFPKIERDEILGDEENG